MKTYKVYPFGLSLAFTLIALAVASCSKDEMESLLPGKPTIQEEGCLDAGLLGTAYFKVTNHTERQTYRWNIDPFFGAQDTDYSDPYASKIKVNTLGNVGNFTITVVAANSYGESERGELSVNVNKDDFPYAIIETSNAFDKSTYHFTNELISAGGEGVTWYENHDSIQWMHNSEDITNPVNRAGTVHGLPSGLLTTTSFYVTVTNNSTGCKTRKTAGANGFE
jgi:hypothetical protein